MICECAFGPRCESNRCCEDTTATMGVRDYRTGDIRARADWSVFHPWQGPPRVMFLCDGCWREIQAAFDRHMPGIDRPKHASEFWRPSIMENIRHGLMEVARQKRMAEMPIHQHLGNQPQSSRERRMTPGQWSQVQVLRQMNVRD